MKSLEIILSRLKNIPRILQFYNLIDGFRFLVASRRRRSRNIIPWVLIFISNRPQKGEGGAQHSWNLYFQTLKYFLLYCGLIRDIWQDARSCQGTNSRRNFRDNDVCPKTGVKPIFVLVRSRSIHWYGSDFPIGFLNLTHSVPRTS